MFRNPTFVSLLFLTASTVKTALAAGGCVAFDANWNLLAFGLNGKDYNAGPQSSWASGSASDITATGRPSFNTGNATCYFSQFGNTIYVLDADSSSTSNIYIYDAAAKSWSTQSTTTGNFDPTNFAAILDHDTNVFYALSKGELYSLDMGELKAAQSTAIPWNDVESPNFPTAGYEPVMALAQNHIHFLDVPGVAAGSADIFVIHFAFFQPASQPYGDFPATHGQTASIFLDEGVQQEFVFVPDDGSATYVINVETNTTQKLAGPSTADAAATYFAAPDSIVQITSAGAVSYLPYNANDTSANAAAKWTVVQNLASVAPASSSAGSSSATGTGTVKSGSGTATKTASSTTGTPSNGGSCVSVKVWTSAIVVVCTLGVLFP